MKINEHRDEYLKADSEGKMKILAKVYGLPGHQVWKHKQSGKWIISHAGVQSIAAQENINVQYVVENMARDFVVIRATPLGGTKAGQTTFGEASPDTTMQKYLVAMAEKRAYDRAVLINVLQVVGGYGADFYSEEEADDFAKSTVPTEAEMGPPAPPLPKPPTNKDIFTADPAVLSRAQLKKRVKPLWAKMYEVEEQEKFQKMYEDDDKAGLAGLITKVENRLNKEGS